MRDNKRIKIITPNIISIISVAILIGTITGCLKGLIYINSNQYIKQQFYNNAICSFNISLNEKIFETIILSLVLCIFFIIAFFILRDEKKSWSVIAGVSASLSIFSYIGYNLNRYTFKDYWKTKKNFLGTELPTAFIEPKIIAVNLGLVFILIALSIILIKVLHFLFNKPFIIESKVFQRKIFVKTAIIVLVFLGILNIFNYFYRNNYKKGMNIVFITVDSLRVDHLGCYGYDRNTSPNIDKLAEKGSLFLRAISQAPWTLPSYTSMLTSKYVSEHGVASVNKRLNPNIKTLPEILRENGYYTAGFISAPFLKGSFGFNQGFDVYDEKAASLVGSWSHSDITSPRITSIVLNFLRKNFNKKLFLFLHYWDVHYDYIPPSPYDKMFNPDYRGNFDGKQFRFNDKFKIGINNDDFKHIVSLYDGEIRWTDKHIGILLNELEKLGISENTVIIFTADHGDEFLEHGWKGHEHTLYDELIRVPLIIKFPDSYTKARRIGKTVESIDIAPTILDLVGIPADREFRGTTLLPLLSGKGEYKNVKAISETAKGLYGSYKSIEIDNVKFIFRSDGKNEMYDLKKDSKERDNLYVKNSVSEKYFEKEIKKYLNYSYNDSSNKNALTESKMDKETEEQLKALGYIN